MHEMKTAIYFPKGKPDVLILIILSVVTGLFACNDDDEPEMAPKVNYSGSFVKSTDAVTTSATGTTTATYDPNTMELSYTISWTGLGSNASGMHFHDDGPVIVPITGFPAATSGTTSGKATLTAQQALDLAASKIYAQIHTTTYPGGEIIARLNKSTSGSNPPPGNGGGGGY
jgi:hypothetical protein